jgi:acyl carrier protein
VDKAQLKQDLKRMIIQECQKEQRPEDLTDDEVLFGDGGRLELDSIDALQISMAVMQRYGKRIEGNNETRNALRTISTLADFIDS